MLIFGESGWRIHQNSLYHFSVSLKFFLSWGLINKYIKDLGVLFGDARSEGAGEGAGARRGKREGPQWSADRTTMSQPRRNETGPSTGADLSQKLPLEFSATCPPKQAGEVFFKAQCLAWSHHLVGSRSRFSCWINEWMNEWTIRCENRHFKISPKSKNNKFLENKALYFKSDNIFSLKLPSSGLLYQVYSGPQCLWRPYLESGNCFKRKLF